MKRQVSSGMQSGAALCSLEAELIVLSAIDLQLVVPTTIGIRRSFPSLDTVFSRHPLSCIRKFCKVFTGLTQCLSQ